MCVIIIAWQVHPVFPLILIANRDEYFDRATLPAAPWQEMPDVIGGRDAERGGTWLGINQKNGRIAAVTNYRDGPLRGTIVSPKSRGVLTADWLKSEKEATRNMTPQEYLESINPKDFEGYNLIVGDMQNGLWCCSNWAPGDKGAVRRLDPGIHGVSNHYMNAPNWPKVSTAKQQLETLLSNTLDDDDDVLMEGLFQILRNDQMYDKDELPDTGIDAGMERMLSSMFVKADKYDYGTRASTVVVANKNGNAQFVERTFGRTHQQEWESKHCIRLKNGR